MDNQRIANAIVSIVSEPKTSVSFPANWFSRDLRNNGFVIDDVYCLLRNVTPDSIDDFSEATRNCFKVRVSGYTPNSGEYKTSALIIINTDLNLEPIQLGVKILRII